jgi:hypothetical protein
MAEEKNKWIDAITKLTKLTQEGKLKWSSASSTDVLVSDDVQQVEEVEAVFTATHKDKRLRLYKKRFKVEEPSNPWFGATSILSHRKYPYWTAQIYLS